MIEKIKSYYQKAVRTSLLVQDKLSKEWYHIFSVIELQVEDEYPYNIPNKEWKNGCIRTQQSKLEDYSFYLTIDEISLLEEAIKTFNNPLESYVVHNQRISFFNSSFIKEPSGEYPLVLASNVNKNEGLSSILPKRRSGLFVWCQIDSERVTEKKFIDSSVSREMLAIQKLTMTWLGFDIVQKREHIGNIYLSAPNPYFREIQVSLSTNPVGVFYKILKRKESFKAINFKIIDKHGDAIALDKTYEVTRATGLINLPHEPHLFELRIYNQDNELIAIHDPVTFIKSIQIESSIKQLDLHVKVESDEGKKEFIVEKFSKGKPLVIGNPNNFNSQYYFKNAEKERIHLELKQKREFIFYPGAKSEMERSRLKEDAKSVIREILNNAKDTSYICDPYFSSTDIIEFAFNIKNSGVKINILNSKEAISKEEAKNIVTVIKNYNSKPFCGIEVHCLRGNSILHDRFIITDKNVWFIGSSFNEFGNRATCIAKVPESSNIIIIKEIEKWFFLDDYSQNIIEYTKEIDNE